jgi:hypothetical protein
MRDGFHRFTKWLSRPLWIVMAVTGLLVACCCCGLLLFPGPEAALGPVKENKFALTHAERVMLAAEQMHKAHVRAEPDDSLDKQLRIAAYGDRTFRPLRSAVSCQWQVKAFQGGQCSLEAEASGRWSEKAARVVLAEFNRFAESLCPGSSRVAAPLVHYAHSDDPQERPVGGYTIRVTLHEETATPDEDWWKITIEFWPRDG